MIAGVLNTPIVLPPTPPVQDQVSPANSESNLTGSLESVASGAVHGTAACQEPNAAPKTAPGTLKSTLRKVGKFIRNWGPNHLILQAGPQLHNALTGLDYKFTPTAVIASDHAELYPLHNEVGGALRAPGNHRVNGYALVVYQQGINIDWKNGELSYLRQMLGRVEADFPYGDTKLQGTIGFEIGITDKSRGFKNSVRHAMSDFQTSSAQALALTGLDFAAHGDLIGALTKGLIVAFAAPEVISRITSEDNARESVLWIGLSFGYADYNGTVMAQLPTLPDISHQGVNMQVNAYLRHGQMMTFDFRTKNFTLPHALIKTLTLANGGDAPAFVSRVLAAKADINHRVNLGHIPAVVGRSIDDCLDEIAAQGVRVINTQNAEHHELGDIVTHV